MVLALIEFFVRNWAMVVMIATVITLIGVPAYVIIRYVPVALNILRSTPPPLARYPLDFTRLHGESVQFSASDGFRLTGMWIPNEAGSQRRGVIIFSHEYGADLYSCARYCRPLVEAGYEVFTFDYRGHGQSSAEDGYVPRQWVTDREVADLRGAVAFVEQRLLALGREPRAGLFGISRGACSALLVAAECQTVRGVVADGAFSTDRVIEWCMRRWAYIFAKVRVLYENHHPHFWRLLRSVMICFAEREFGCRFPSVIKSVRSMRPMPTLFIHGEKDSYLPVDESRALYSVAPQPKALWVAPGAKHNQAVALHPEIYAALTVEFYDRYLAKCEEPTRIAPAPAVAAPVAVA